MKRFQKGFTLAEVLITLGIIGIVAAMTIPTLIQKYQERAWNTSASVFEARLITALKTMNVQDSLSGLGSTENFVSQLSKFMKVTKTCSNTELNKCFSNSITTEKDGEKTTVSMNDSAFHLSTAKDLGHKDWTTNVMGIQFANGITGLIAYNNHDCNSDSYNNDSGSVSNCLALAYDTSGYSNPNIISKDIRTFNAPKIGTICGGTIADGKCVTVIPGRPAPITCLNGANSQYCGTYYANTQDDYWAGSNKMCKDAGMRLPALAELSSLFSSNELINAMNMKGAFTSDESSCVYQGCAYKFDIRHTNLITEGNMPKARGEAVSAVVCVGD